MIKSWIVHQEKTWLVLDKPAGLSVHNDPGNDLISLCTAALNSPVAPVYRLDQETSGLILLSLSSETTALWHKSLELLTTQKDYLCIVRGDFSATSGIWSLALTDKAEGRKNPQGMTHDRKPCETQYQVLSSNKYFSQLSCRLKTGRQHQIRKHAALARHAIIGDSRYGDPKYNAMIAERYDFKRLALHAHRLHCTFGNKTYDWLSPIPTEFSKLVST